MDTTHSCDTGIRGNILKKRIYLARTNDTSKNEADPRPSLQNEKPQKMILLVFLRKTFKRRPVFYFVLIGENSSGWMAKSHQKAVWSYTAFFLRIFLCLTKFLGTTRGLKNGTGEPLQCFKIIFLFFDFIYRYEDKF